MSIQLYRERKDSFGRVAFNSTGRRRKGGKEEDAPRARWGEKKKDVSRSKKGLTNVESAPDHCKKRGGVHEPKKKRPMSDEKGLKQATRAGAHGPKKREKGGGRPTSIYDLGKQEGGGGDHHLNNKRRDYALAKTKGESQSHNGRRKGGGVANYLIAKEREGTP